MDERLWHRRFKRASRVARALSFVPFVRMVGLNGSMATGSMKETSDIDFYVVLAAGHLFLGRLLVTGVVQALGVRLHGKVVANRVCLNRYSTDDFLDITEHNDYHAHVFSNLVPLWAVPGVYSRYREANEWMRGFGFPVTVLPIVVKTGSGQQFIQGFFEFLLGWKWLERLCSNWQKRRIQGDPRQYENDGVVVVSDQELRFHKRLKHG